jgi:hypothetical protein
MRTCSLFSSFCHSKTGPSYVCVVAPSPLQTVVIACVSLRLKTDRGILFFQALGPETFMATYLAAGATSSLTDLHVVFSGAGARDLYGDVPGGGRHVITH